MGSPHTGLARLTAKQNGGHLSLQFLQNKLLERDAQHGSLRVTQKGWGVLNRNDAFWGFPVASVDRATPELEPEYSRKLFELLRTERDRITEAEGVPYLYEVFHDKALQAMATYFPTSEESFRQMPSVGPARSEKYADVFLPIIREYLKKQGTDSVESGSQTLNTYEPASDEPNEYAPELFELLRAKRKNGSR